VVHAVALPEDEFVKECIGIVEKAQNKGIILRILGALAVYIKSEHCSRCRELQKSLGRLEGGATFTDLDLMAYRKQSKDIKKFFEKDLGFIPDRYVNTMFGGRRLIYYHPDNYYHIDIFFNKLEFSHDIYFGEKPGKGRLELDYPTITPTDIVLEKLQIHDINRKDIIDLIVLFLGHELSDSEGKALINAKYIAQVLADDWGFWYDATNNLKLVKEFANKFMNEGKLTAEEGKLIIAKVDKLLEYIDREPKTKKWLKRAKVGTKKPWYRVVEEVER